MVEGLSKEATFKWTTLSLDTQYKLVKIYNRSVVFQIFYKDCLQYYAYKNKHNTSVNDFQKPVRYPILFAELLFNVMEVIKRK